MAASGFNRPHQRRTARRIVAALLIIAAVSIVLADQQYRASSANGRLSVDDPSAKLLRVIAAPARGATSLFSNFEARNQAFIDNKTLRVEVAQLQLENSKMLELQSRVSHLEAMMDMKMPVDIEARRILTRVVDEKKGPFVHTALMNVGKTDGIKQGHAVMTAQGYLGYVVRAGETSSRILLANDLSSRIAVKSARSGARAIMVGTNSQSPELRYIDEEADWAPGDIIHTSGDGGVLPAGLHIGVARKSKNSDFEVELATAKKPVDWVFVYLFEPVKAPSDTDVVPAPKPAQGPTTQPAEAQAAENPSDQRLANETDGNVRPDIEQRGDNP